MNSASVSVMSSSSDVTRSARDGQPEVVDYLLAPQLIWRAVVGGAIARRWDTEGEIVMLNPSAWMVVESLLSGPGPMDLDAIVRSIESRATFDPSGVEELRLVLRDLVGRNLVIGIE